MSRCHQILKEGEDSQCRNRVKVENYCHLHRKDVSQVILPYKFHNQHIRMRKETRKFLLATIKEWTKKLRKLESKEDHSERELKKIQDIHSLITYFKKFEKLNRSIEFIDFVNSNLLHKTVKFYTAHQKYDQQQTVKNLVIKTILPENIILGFGSKVTGTFYLDIVKETLKITDSSRNTKSQEKIHSQIRECREIYNHRNPRLNRFTYFPIRINFVEGGAHSNAGIVDFQQKEILLIEPHVTKKWEPVVFQALQKSLYTFDHYEFKSLSTESCPKFLQGNDNLCQTWAMYVAYLYLSRGGQFQITNLLETLGEEKIKNGLLEFVYYIYHQFKDEMIFKDFIKKPQIMTVKRRLIKNNYTFECYCRSRKKSRKRTYCDECDEHDQFYFHELKGALKGVLRGMLR